MGAALKHEILDETGGAFLGVAISARGYCWRERLRREDAALADAISQRFGLHELLGRVLAARGAGLDDVETLMEPTLKALMPDPSQLQDMDKAAVRLADAIEKKEGVAVFGDYDVDGASSSALMARFFSHHGMDARIYIPDRLAEGYGPNAPAIEMLAKDGASLIVTVDCGTTSHEPLKAARLHGADVIIIDHHQADEILPEVAAVVNPNRQDDVSGQGDLCAAGVVFLVMVAAVRELRKRGHYEKGTVAPNLLADLDLVALATVCDVVPLTGLNRAYVRQGLHVMRQRDNTGLRALFDVAGLSEAPTPYHLGFILGPRINAGGRIGNSALGSKLLSTRDEGVASQIAALLDKLNKERKAIETQMLEQAMAEADVMVEADPDLPILVLGSEQFHKGVVGLVASRLTDRFRRPSCVLSWTKDGGGVAVTGTGSLRSIAGVDIGGAVRAAVDEGLLLKGGGHAMAAGLSVAQENLEPLRAFLRERLAESAGVARAGAALDLDGALTPSGASMDLLALIEKAGPYGQGNPQPRFAFPSVRVKYAKVVGNAHVRCALEGGDGKRVEAIAFRAAGQPVGDLLLEAAGFPIHVCGTLRRDTWGGRNRIELMIDDAADPRKAGRR